MDIQQAARAYRSDARIAAEANHKMQELLTRSATDPEFRQKLLTDPRAAFSEFTGREIPEPFNVRFIENKAGATVVLPDPIDPEAEMSEQDLEAVAGGTTYTILIIVSITLDAYHEFCQ